MDICSSCQHRDECDAPTKGLDFECLGRRLLAKNVRRLRKQKGLTQKELSHRAGIDRTYLTRLETEAINVSVNVVFALAKSLDTRPESLFNFDIERPESPEPLVDSSST
jgi:transcriptional regulator with XRE-family HTH domain